MFSLPQGLNTALISANSVGSFYMEIYDFRNDADLKHSFFSW